MRRRRIVNIGGTWINPDNVDFIASRSDFTNDPGIPDIPNARTVVKTSSGFITLASTPEASARWIFGRRACK